MPVRPDQELSHYRLVEKIGEGGMGVVWKARDTVLNRMVAIKVLPADASRDEERRQMFLKEARLASSISDAHIVQVHEFGHEGDLDFIVMEYIDGKPLNRIIHGRPLPPDTVADLGLQVAKALSRAHRKSLLHRDLKPANILVTPDGDAKVVDFGLAALLERGDVSGRWNEVTRTETASADQESPPDKGALVGTLSYMSPEQVRCESVDGRTDIFSLGVILYEMATGERPFSGPTSSELLQAIAKARVVPPHQLVRELPLELNRIIQKTLGRRPADRYQTMDDLAVDLRRLGRELESGSSPSYEDMAKALAPRPRRQVLLAVMAGAVALLALGLVGWWIGFGRGPALDERTVLILPMEIRGKAEAPDYAGREFAEALANHLARSRELKVLPIADADDLTGDGFGRAREVGAGRLLMGALVHEGDAIQASLSLMDVTENRILWGTQQEEPEGDLSTLASSLAKEVVAQLGATFAYEYPFLTGGPEMGGAATRGAKLKRKEGREVP